MTWLAVLLGAVVGLALGEMAGAAAGAALAWLALAVQRQGRAIDALHERLEAQKAASLPTARATRPDAPVETVAAVAAVAAVAPVEAVEIAKPFEAAAPLEPLEPQQPAAAVQPLAPIEAPPPTPGLIARAKAWLWGGNTIAKLGVGILFLGLAFLAKYAAEHTQLPVELRLAGIGAVALALLALGWRLRRQRPAYAFALQGGAVAVLYLTLFVGFKFYGVIAAGPVFATMVLVAGLAAALAVLQDAKSLALIGALGGFATPLLVSTGSGNALALFSYYLVLNLGIAAVA
jgi:uncharacterized membrane protein